jgi:cardiolipin synthase
LHAKTAIIDGVWSCVGSSNLDWRSALDNDEISAIVVGQAFATQMNAAFTNDLVASKPILLKDWVHRPVWNRIKEWSAQLWERLL